MAKKNLVSATLTEETKADILDKLASIKKSLGFLLTLDSKQVKALLKSGNGYSAFIEKAYSVALEHSEFLPGVFDLNEYKRDYQLGKDLSTITHIINELADSLRDTQLALNSDILNGSLDVYSAVKRNKSEVAGGNLIADEMAEFFKKSKKAIAAATSAST
jgi:hypothetical protein